jgi:hypothetical protein
LELGSWEIGVAQMNVTGKTDKITEATDETILEESIRMYSSRIIVTV